MAMNINDIHPYEQNAKKHPVKQVDQIARSIQEFGFNQPIVVDKNNEIIVGHGRYYAATKLGLTDVPVTKLENLTDEQVQAYRLADNKLNESEWDMSLVIENLKYLDSQNYDITLTGFDKDLIIEPDDKDDVIPEDAPPVATLGDIWQLGRHRLMCGDSTKLEDVEKLMDGQKADMVFTDPPYNVDYGSNTNPIWGQQRAILNDKMSDTDWQAFMDGFLTLLILNTKGAIYIAMSCKELATLQTRFKAMGGHWSSNIIWDKQQLVPGRKDYQSRYEPILYGWPERVNGHFWCGSRTETDLWEVKRPSKSEMHPTMKPVELVSKAITNSSKGEDIILDLFGGSGSTLIAAEKTGRTCYMMELDPKYCDVIIKRYEEYTGNKAAKLN